MVTCTTITVSAPLTVTVKEYGFRCVAGCTPDEDICGTVPYEKVKTDNVWFKVIFTVAGGFLSSFNVSITVNYTEGTVAKTATTTASGITGIGDWTAYIEHVANPYKASTTYTITSVTAVKL